MATLRVTLKQQWFGNEVRNTLHFAGGDAVQSNAQGIGDYLRSQWATHLQAHLVDEWDLYGFAAKELDVVSNPTIDYTFTAGELVGTETAESLPTQVAKLVSWIALTARPNRGRTYLAGFSEDAAVNGVFTNAIMLSAVADWAQGVIDIDTAFPGLALVVARVDKATGVLVGSNIIETFRNPTNPAIQRSRRRGSGI